MRSVDVSIVTRNIKEMCIEANHYLSSDMKEAIDKSVVTEKSTLGKKILNRNFHLTKTKKLRLLLLQIKKENKDFMME